MPDLRNTFIAVVLLTALIPTGVPCQSPQTTHLPDHFEYFEGHAYMGGEWVKWEKERLVLIKRVADMQGKGSFHETREQLEPPPAAWQRFWTHIDSLGVWQWKSDYSSSKSSLPDGESWSLNLEHGAKQVKSKGYNAVPEAYGKFREAVRSLMEDARRHSRK
jgi:hypothetical protein